MVGVSTFSGYSYNESSMLSSRSSTSSTRAGRRGHAVWGEEGGGSRKPVVERHVQTEIRAIVAPAPYPRSFAPGPCHAEVVSVGDDVELLGPYWTVSGPVEVHVGREDLFDWTNRCAEASRSIKPPQALARRGSSACSRREACRS